MAFDYARYFREITLTRDLLMPPDTTARWRLTPPARSGEHHEVVLYLGCNIFRTAHLAQTVMAVFDRLGVDYVAVGGPTYCCGIVHQQHGHEVAGGGMAHHAVEMFRRFSPVEVVAWCPSCLYYFDEVQHLALPFRLRHAAEFLLDHRGKLGLASQVRSRVALHGHGPSEARRREAAAMERLLATVPGVEVVPLTADARFGRSCSAAIPEALGPEGWRELALGEVDRALAAGADRLATAYHGCQRLLCEFEAERPVTIEHYLTVFARALGIEYEDTYKKYKRWADPDRVLADMAPCQRSRDVDPGAARALAEVTFVPLGPMFPRSPAAS